MKFTRFLTSIVLFASAALCAEDASSGADAAGASTEDLSPKDFQISYKVNDEKKSPVYRLFNEETVTLTYTFTSYEKTPLSIVGVGGAFKDSDGIAPVVNLTDVAVGPFELEETKSAEFEQVIQVDLVPGSYVLAPVLYLYFNNQLFVIAATPSLITAEDRGISYFDPQLLSALAIVGAIFGGISYVVVKFIAWPYISKNYLKKNAPKLESLPKKKAVKKAAVSTGVDESWLPDTYLKQKSKKK